MSKTNEKETKTVTGLEIAVIGMAGRFPGARNLEEYWENLKNGVESLVFLTDEQALEMGTDPRLVSKPGYVKTLGGLLEDKEYFDASFFGYTPAEAEVMDPQQRILHECAWEALESAGYNTDSYEGSIGLYAGSSANFDWESRVVLSGKRDLLGNFVASSLMHRDYLCTRTAYKLNLKGPAVVVQTACSTGLAAIHIASRALITADCRMALAGGVKVMPHHDLSYQYQEGLIGSKDGHCRAFDAEATGTASGDGVGLVVLKRLKQALADRDHIHAVIKGSFMNNDGTRRIGFSAPGIEGQAEAIKKAYFLARVDPETITYVEAHGTGTSLGDPIEMEALKRAFNTDKRGYCAVGSVKTNIGHLDTAAGIAGFIKTVLALGHRRIPPSLHFNTPNPKIDFDNSPFYVNTRPREWQADGHPLRAGINSFGMGGTNVHLILEEAPPVAGEQDTAGRDYHLILLSAATPTALETMSRNLRDHIETVSLADTAYTLQVGRKTFNHRRMIVCRDTADAVRLLSDPDSQKVHSFSSNIAKRKSTIFIFSGMGAQYVNMGVELYRDEHVFRREMDRCFEILTPLMGEDIKGLLYPSRETPGDSQVFSRAQIIQPVLFSFEYALAVLLMEWGITPDAMIGYSFGEYTAACIAGVISLEDTLSLIVTRGELINSLSPGAMLSVPLPKDQVIPLLDDDLSLAVDNGPSCIAAGDPEAVHRLEERLKERKCMCMRVPTTFGIHSHLMDPILEKFAETVRRVELRHPKIPYISNVTGNWITPAEAVDPAYWVSHLRQTVQFADGLRQLIEREPDAVFLEIGPGRDLTVLAQRYIENGARQQALNLVRPEKKQVSDTYYLLNRLGYLWLYGKTVDWPRLHAQEKFRRIPLPTYPFERQRFWIEEDVISIAVDRLKQSALLAKKSDIADWFYIPRWNRSAVLPGGVPRPAHWLVLVDDCGPGALLVKRLESDNHPVVTVKPGMDFLKENDRQFTINPVSENHYNKLFEQLGLQDSPDGVPLRILHLWNVTAPVQEELTIERVRRSRDLGFHSLLNIAKSVGNLDIKNEVQVTVITNNMQEVIGEDILFPGKSLVLGPVKVIPTEYDNISCRSIDVDLSRRGGRPIEDIVSRLYNELQPGINEPVVAYRGSHRWLQSVEPLRFEKSGKKKPLLREKGVYLITGGLGGVGLVLARYLAEKVRARLILTGRDGLPDPKEWEQTTDARLREKIQKVKALEALGAEVLVCSADVADPERMAEVVAQARQRFGAVNGIIHSAGIADGEMISRRTRETSEGIFAAKLSGTLVLHQLLGDMEADFFIICSSLNAILPVFGQVGYCAANAFLDAFADHCHSSAGKGPLVASINWDHWQGIGIAVIAEAEHKKLTGNDLDEGITAPEGMEIFDRVLSRPMPRVAVSSRDLSLLIEQFAFLKASSLVENLAEARLPETRYHRPQLDTEYTAPRSETEKTLARLWADFFGFDRVGVHDDFFDLGGDSLKGMTMAALIHKKIDVRIPITVIFDTPTIRGLAEFMAKGARDIFVSIEPVEDREYYPLSSAQKRLYILQRMEPDSTGYNMPQFILLEGEPEKERLENIFKKLIFRHESLRTSFFIVDGEPVQKIHKEVPLKFEYYELPAGDTGDTGEDGHIGILHRRVRPFELSLAPLLRVELIKAEEKKHILMADMHHIISDGISLDILVRDFSVLYSGGELLPMRLQYRDFSQWQNRNAAEGKGNDVLKQQQDYWLKQLGGEIPVLSLPFDYPRPAVQSFEGGITGFGIEKEIVDSLKKLAQKQGATLYMVLSAIFNVLLSKISGQEDIVVGTPIAGRNHADLEQIIGMLVNTLVLRNRPLGEITFTRFLETLRNNTLEAFENQDYQFETLVGNVSVSRDAGRNPVFDVAFVLRTITARPDAEPGEETNLNLQPLPYKTGISKFDLTLNAVERPENLSFSFEYCTKLFKKETIDRFIEYFLRIVSSVVEEPDRQILSIDVLSPDEKRQLLFGFNDTAAAYPEDKTIHQIFEEQVEKTPYKVSLVHMIDRSYMSSMTYAQLNKKSNRVARQLRERGAGPGTITAMVMDRDPEMIAGILGILKAGGAYLPIDPEYPQDRIDYILNDSNAKIVLNPRADSHGKSPIERGTPKGGAESLAYIIYTSGSTGRPKGVMIEHRNVVRLMFNDRFQFNFDDTDVWTMFHSYCFDFSVWEMYGALLYGGKLLLIPKMTARDPKQYLEILKKEQATVLNQTPAAFYNLAGEERKDPGKALNLKYVIFGGELLKPAMLKEWKDKYPRTKLVNMFGITETTVHVTYKELEDRDIRLGISNIGSPIPTLTTYVMDRHLEPTPIGVPGELCVGGEGVGRGYLNRPELTMEKFVLNPHIPGERLYRSGDLGKRIAGGDMEYLGRIDFQVKIRGFRIELGEIENRLLTHPHIKEAVVLARQRGADRYLIAFIVHGVPQGSPPGLELTASGMREYLSRHLPDYMIPSYFVPLERMLLTPNGKVDKKALISLETSSGMLGTGVEFIAPEGEVEERIAALWKEVLNLENVGVHDNFFDLGGNSMYLLKIGNKLRENFKKDIPVVELFQYPTIRSLTRYLNEGMAADNPGESVRKLEALDEGKNRMKRLIKHTRKNSNG